MNEQQELDSPLSSIARGGGLTAHGHGFEQEQTRTGAGQAREETAIASDDHRRTDTEEARLERIEARLAYMGVSLSYMEAYRNYIDLRLQEAAEDVAYAGDVALAYVEVSHLYADNDLYAASFGRVGLLAQVEDALTSMVAYLAQMSTRLAQIGSAAAYTGQETDLSYLETGLADAEVALVGIGATLAHAEALLADVVGAGTREAPNLVRIPLPSEISAYASVSGQR
jgi:hypothetical protein